MPPTNEPPDVERIRAARAHLQHDVRRSDPELRAQTEMILAMPVEARLRQLEAEAEFFSGMQPIDE